MLYTHESGRVHDMITGERVERGERLMDTEIKTIMFNPARNNRTMFIKESTIVWLAEKAGYTLIRSDARDSGNAESVDESDASTGGGEDSVGTATVGGGKTPDRRNNGKSKS